MSAELNILARVLEDIAGPGTTVQIFSFTLDLTSETPEREFPQVPFDFIEPLEIPGDENFDNLGFSYMLKPIEGRPEVYTMAVPYIADAGYDQTKIDAFLAELNADPDYPNITDATFIGINAFAGN